MATPSRAGAPTPSLRRRRAGRRSPAKRPSTGSARRSPVAPEKRPPADWEVAGIRLDRELERLRELPVFAAGPLADRRPELKVRRASKRPNRVGFAVPAEHRLQVTSYPGIRPGDVLETLLHELVHLHVGRAREAHAWHGRTFKATLARAMEEAYGVRGVAARSTLHGAYAEAIERLRDPQLELDLT
ncbi:MAG TPA: hypothetical protein VHA76_05575 [Solirubrobacterales bacterium]|nr:hypothetical protein [Solirubrobacterales bacterium]